MRRLVPGVLGILFFAVPARGGEMLSLGDQTFGADTVVELYVLLAGPAPSKGQAPDQAAGNAFSEALAEAACKEAFVERMLRGPESEEKPALAAAPHCFSAGSPCWRKAHARGSLRMVAFLRRDESGALQQSFGVEVETGLYTDLNPRYEELVAAIEGSRFWHEERMRAVGAEMLWQDERAALSSDNPYLAQLAAEFLRQHDSASVVDEVWGLPGTEARSAREKAVALPAESVCKP